MENAAYYQPISIDETKSIGETVSVELAHLVSWCAWVNPFTIGFKLIGSLHEGLQRHKEKTCDDIRTVLVPIPGLALAG